MIYNEKWVGCVNSFKEFPENPNYGSLIVNLEDEHVYCYIGKWEKGYTFFIPTEAALDEIKEILRGRKVL